MSAEELFQAVEDQDLDRLTTILEAGQNPNVHEADLGGWTPLHHAIEDLDDGGPLEAVRVLIEHGAEVDRWDTPRSSTPLIIAVANGRIDAARLLLEAGADPNVMGEGTETPLLMAVGERSYQLVKLLLEFGAAQEIDHYGGDTGMTALGIATSQLDLELVKLLLEAGADVDATDDEHKLARQHAPTLTEDNRSSWESVMRILNG